MEVDGNLHALKMYEREVATNEEAYEAFIQEVIDIGIADDYEEMRGKYEVIREKYNFDETLEKFIKENI